MIKKNDIRKLDKVEKRSGVKKMGKRCQHCGGVMRARGSSDAVGSQSWKCRNKKCGRTEWKRHKVVPPKPLVPYSFFGR